MASGRRHSLDGLRGYAALAVTFYHGILHFDLSLIDRVLYRPISLVALADLPTKLLLIVFNGESAVIVFFVLSGFVLRGALERLSPQPFAKTAAVFAWRRVARIYPAVIACMTLFFLISLACARAGIATFPHFQAIQFLQNVTLYWPAMHGPSWSMQVEICAVPFLLAAEALRRGLGTLGLLVCLFYALIGIEFPVLVFRLPALWPYLFMFYTGMLLLEPAVAGAVRKLHPACSLIALVMFVAGRHVTERGAISGLIAQGLAGGLLVACVAYRTDALTAFLARPVSLFLGRISYSFYLMNVIALYSCWAVIEAWVPAPAHHPVLWGLLSAVVSVGLTIPVAALSERWIERPGVALGRSVERLLAAIVRPGAARPMVVRPLDDARGGVRGGS